MRKIAVVYWSGTGNTEAMAGFVAEGATAEGAEVDNYLASDFSVEKVKEYSAIAFGCPSMGAEQLEETEFEPMFMQVKPALGGKSVALFGSYGWGDGEWMRSWADDCNASGCHMVSDPVTVNGAPEDDEATACKALGAALAKA